MITGSCIDLTVLRRGLHAPRLTVKQANQDPMMKALFAAALAAATLMTSFEASAIVMRHDVNEAAYLSSFDDWPATAYFSFRGRFGSATGTLIAPRWVLTAGHVSMHVKPGDTVTVNGQLFQAKRAITHDAYDPQRPGRDIGLVELESASDVAPVRLYRGEDEVGMEVTFVGAGRPGNGQVGAGGELGTIRQAHNRVEGIMYDTIVFHFDAGDEALPLEGISGPGDSGGPAYVEIDGELYTIGVSAFQDFDGDTEGVYGAREHYSRVSHYANWIDSVVGGE